MLNIREYFDNLYKNANTDEEWDNVMEYENSVYEMANNVDSDDFDNWLIANNIDTEATEMVCNRPVKVLTLWGWDMCGD